MRLSKNGGIKNGIKDISGHLIKSFIAHPDQNSPHCPVPTTEQVLVAYKQGIYTLVFFIWHPDIKLSSPKVLADAAAYVMCARTNMMLFSGGIMHNALINNVYSEHFQSAHDQFGHMLLRPYHGNEEMDSTRRKFLFCRTRNKEISDLLKIPGDIPANIDDWGTVASQYRPLFNPKDPSKEFNVTEFGQRELHICYLAALGFTQEQAIESIKLVDPESRMSLSYLRVLQNQVCHKLYRNWLS